MTTRPSTTSTTTAPSPSTRASPTSPSPCPPPSPDLPCHRRSPASFRSRYLQLPDQLDPRIPELAQQIAGSEATPYLRALAIERYLSTRYQYTLQLPSQPPADPIADFLFSRRRGHCEYFASSMAILLRTVGIPSRIITGFRGAQFNQLNANYIVRASDAHSWVEAYIPGAGWTTFDPTPAGDAAAPSPSGPATSSTSTPPTNSGASGSSTTTPATSRRSPWPPSAKPATGSPDFRRWWTLRYNHMLEMARRIHHSASSNPRRLLRAGIILIVFGLLLALPYAILQFRARWRAGSPRLSPRSAASILYLRMVRFLARRGYSRAPAQTPAEFAASIDDPALREAVLRFTDAYQHARFAGSTTEAATLPALLDELRNLPARP